MSGPHIYRFARQLHINVPALSGQLTRAADTGCGACAGAVVLAQRYPVAAIQAMRRWQAANPNVRLTAHTNAAGRRSAVLAEIYAIFG